MIITLFKVPAPPQIPVNIMENVTTPTTDLHVSVLVDIVERLAMVSLMEWG